MMVPRGFTTQPQLSTSPPKDGPQRRNSKNDGRKPSLKSEAPTLPRMKSDPTSNVSSPMTIPARRQMTRIEPSPRSIPVSPKAAPAPTAKAQERARTFQGRDILTSTAIPVRRKAKARKIQRLPDCDHVAEFSKLMLDDLRNRDETLVSNSLGNPHFDNLFGHLDGLVDGQIMVESDPDEPVSSFLSMRSASSDSMPSFDLNDDSTMSNGDGSAASPSTFRSPPDKRRNFSTSEETGQNHPLLYTDAFPLPEEDFSQYESTPRFPRSVPQAPKSKSKGFFKSNLSISLKAIRSAAQGLSSLALTSIPSEDFLTRSVFNNIDPHLTDDKRPPPSPTGEVPPPAIRRYLNAPPRAPGSPSELHIWHELPKSTDKSMKKKSKKEKNGNKTIPVSVPLQSCLPSPIRTSTASSPPIWLGPDGTPTRNKDVLTFFAGPTFAKQREPRENCDFLRVLVAEINMRRAGKFSEEMESHAFVWLPARKAVSVERAGRMGTERLREL